MKRGFTLIELLAVIVILAIIAVIAVPIVLNIIDETKNNAGLRSAEMYLKAAELSIAQSILKDINITDGTYNLIDGDICIGEISNNKCNGELLEVEVNGKVPDSGTITITNGNITGLNISLNEKEIYKNSKGELVYTKFLDEVCEFKEGTPKTVGAKYECKVDPNKSAYTFYVLTTPTTTDTSINLIMNQNINSDGTPAGMTSVNKSENTHKYNLVEWISEEKYYEDVGGVIPNEVLNDGGLCQYGHYCVPDDKGALTAMSFLQTATKMWTNTNEMIINMYTDEIGTAKKEMEIYNTYARMPIYLTDPSKTEVTSKTNAPYLYDNLAIDDIGPNGYWTFTPNSNYIGTAWFVLYAGNINYDYVYAEFGIRPVITLKI